MSPHPFTLRQLQYVLAVADLLSFRKAAEACHVSQPSLSAQLAQVEETVGLRLFERDRRRVLPTVAGVAFIERARVLLREADELVAMTRQLGDPFAGTLRFGIIPTISAYLLPSVTPALRRAYPRLTVLWTEDKTGPLLAALERGTLDAVVLALEAELGDVEREIIAIDPFLLATRRDDPLGASHLPVARTELKDANVLLLDDGHCFRTQALSYCARVRAQELEFRATSLSTLAQMVAGGAGVTLLPQLAISTEATRAKLKVRAFAAPAPSRTLALVWRKRSVLAAPLRALTGTLREALPSYPERAQSKRRPE